MNSMNMEATLGNLRQWDLGNWLPNSQLFKLDKISMAHSIEAREPFVDQDLIASVMALDPARHFRLKRDKPVFRGFLKGQTRLNDRVTQGRKSSFFRPFTGERNIGLRREIRELLQANRPFLEDFIQPKVLDGLLRDDDMGMLSQKRLFALGMLVLWRERLWKLAGSAGRAF